MIVVMNKAAKAVFILTLFSVIERVLGFLFKIYLSNEMGATSLGIYQAALSFFFVLLSLTTSGLPLVMGKLTAAYDVTGQKKRADSLVSAGLLINIIMSVVLCCVVLLAQGLLKSMMASDQSIYVLLIFLPALVFGSLGTAFRGSLWGREKYFAVSLIELIEQIVRILLCTSLFLLGINKLEGAAISLVIATFINAFLCGIFFFAGGGKLSKPNGQFKPLLRSSAPISGLKAASSLVNSIMAVIIPMLFVASGLNNDTAMAYYGASVGMALPLLYLPVTVVGALAYTLIPTISKAMSRGDKKEVRRQIDSAIIFSVVVASIFIPVFYSLGEPLGIYVFNGNVQAGQFLKLGGILLLPISVESIVSSMMNSLGLELRGFFNFMIGSAVMFGIMFGFYGRFTIDVFFWALFASLVVSTILDIICIKRKTGASLKFIKTIGLAVALSYPSICVCNWCYNLFSFMHELVRLGCAGIIGTAMLILLGIVFGLIDIKFIFSFRKRSVSIQGLLKKQKKRRSASVRQRGAAPSLGSGAPLPR